jgi:hypothetical protein
VITQAAVVQSNFKGQHLGAIRSLATGVCELTFAPSILWRWQQIAMAYDGEGPYSSPLGASSGSGVGRELVPLAADALARGLARKGPYTLIDAPNSPVPLKLTW